jgi:hypothetical protein
LEGVRRHTLHDKEPEVPAITRRITALGVTAVLAAGALAAPASSVAKATGPGKYTVAVDATYTFHKGPHQGFDGTLFRGNTFKVKRISKSGKWAYGMAYGHVNRHAWVRAADLTRKR